MEPRGHWDIEIHPLVSSWRSLNYIFSWSHVHSILRSIDYNARLISFQIVRRQNTNLSLRINPLDCEILQTNLAFPLTHSILIYTWKKLMEILKLILSKSESAITIYHLFFSTCMRYQISEISLIISGFHWFISEISLICSNFYLETLTFFNSILSVFYIFKILKNTWKLIVIYWNLMQSLEICGNFLKFYEILSKR